ncbi:MAG: hypothetical protein HC769_12415 [Cyanobacteria bacterium CRU_2_1]|nr:hypothetical protein [Cyanobacteria bacterium CRU_2_1]
MEVEHFSTEELSPEEIKQLEELKRIIEAAVSDGILSHSELEHIKNVAFAHKRYFQQNYNCTRNLYLKNRARRTGVWVVSVGSV